MKVIVSMDGQPYPPVLRLTIFDAPHRRVHVRVIQEYRKALVAACRKAGIKVPVEEPIDLMVTFINPTSPDLGNSYLALEQAMDGTTLTKPGVVVDDGLISKVTMMKLSLT